jgi:hypothetical protein
MVVFMCNGHNNHFLSKANNADSAFSVPILGMIAYSLGLEKKIAAVISGTNKQG